MSNPITLDISPMERVFTEPCSVLVKDVPPGAQVTIEATLSDRSGQAWSSRGVFYADHKGIVDVARDASIAGTYHGVDAEGIFWSMLPATLDELISDGAGIKPADSDKRYTDFDDFRAGHTAESYDLRKDPVQITVSARLSGAHAATPQATSVAHTVHMIRPGVERIAVSEGELQGAIYEAAGEGPHPIAVVVTGSGGGANEMKACALASHGITAFALAHFNHPGRPASLLDMPIEYFSDAIDWFAERYGQKKVALMGDSRGGEGVLVIASHLKDRINALIPGVPSNMMFAGVNHETLEAGPAWMVEGKHLPYVNWSFSDFRPSEVLSGSMEARDIYRHDMTAHDIDDPRTIPVENIDCPILLISGEVDAVWPSNMASERVLERLKAKGFEHSAEHIEYKGGGHLVNYPMLVKSRAEYTEVNEFGFAMAIGGNPSDNAFAQTDAFHKTVQFVKEHSSV
ncbi:MAG: acyl-CoA thioester hydrolase/BAAT C-terminal domain-containing protein [Pseudomonadota bacterium]